MSTDSPLRLWPLAFLTFYALYSLVESALLEKYVFVDGLRGAEFCAVAVACRVTTGCDNCSTAGTDDSESAAQQCGRANQDATQVHRIVAGGWCAAGVGVVAVCHAQCRVRGDHVALGNRPSSAEQRAALLMLTQAVFSDRPDAASDFRPICPVMKCTQKRS